ncbi:nuclear transport factor 2 family protein [Flavihumibacter petaseus]|nr:nuclear transport factor 2 family protein [Flavihumibacter petaseus]
MHRKLYLLLIAIACSAILMAQQQTSSSLPDAVDALNKAILDADSSALARLTDKRLTYGHSVGRIEDRDQFIRALVSGGADFKTLQVADQTILYSGNTGVVRHVLTAVIVDKGNEINLKLAVLQVWEKQKSGWKLLARQASKLP